MESQLCTQIRIFNTNLLLEPKNPLQEPFKRIPPIIETNPRCHILPKLRPQSKRQILGGKLREIE